MMKTIAVLLLCCVLSFSAVFPVYATEPVDNSTVDTPAVLDENAEGFSLPVQSNELEGWPEGPPIAAHSAILMDADTGTILYEKNMNDIHFPASITKVMTVLLALENCKLDEQVSFSNEAVFSIEPGSSSIGITPGEQISLEDCLYGIMLPSANEVANAVGEHIAGSREGFAQMMNERAKQLGCQNTNFYNACGLHNEEHHTSAYDMALITREALKHPMFRTVTGSKQHSIPPTNLVAEPRVFQNKHKMLMKGNQYYYDGSEGGKTGYTTVSKNTLVTFAKRGDMELICVTMQTVGRQVYTDTASLFDYGFQNFHKELIPNPLKKSSSINANCFEIKGGNILSQSYNLTLDRKKGIILPNNASFSDVECQFSLKKSANTLDGSYSYKYKGIPVGDANIISIQTNVKSERADNNSEQQSFSFADNKNLIYFIGLGIFILIILIGIGIYIVKHYHISH